jgi:hypothetical protein
MPLKVLAKGKQPPTTTLRRYRGGCRRTCANSLTTISAKSLFGLDAELSEVHGREWGDCVRFCGVHTVLLRHHSADCKLTSASSASTFLSIISFMYDPFAV